MSDPIHPLLATGGLVLFGIVTGLHPMLLVAGFGGCWWYNSYLPEITFAKRIATAIVAGFFAAWLTPPIVVYVCGLDWWPDHVPPETVAFPSAFIIGFLTQRVIGPQLLRLAQKKAEEIL